jgi:hypothetical protein
MENVRVPVGDVLADSLVRAGGVVVHLVLGQDGTEVGLAEDQHPVQELTGNVPTRRSQVAFIRGAWTAVRRMVVPAGWKMASNGAVKLEPWSRIRNVLRHEVACCE